MKPMQTKKLTYWSSVVVIGAVLGISLQFVKAWTDPVGAPPAGNLGAPINTGNNVQIKSGTLQVNGSVVAGNTTSTPSPAPNGVAAGNAYANDIYLSGSGKWASQTAVPAGMSFYDFGSNVGVYLKEGANATASTTATFSNNDSSGGAATGSHSIKAVASSKIEGGVVKTKVSGIYSISAYAGSTTRSCDSGWKIGNTASCTPPNSNYGATGTVSATTGYSGIIAKSVLTGAAGLGGATSSATSPWK